jgi:hypothetical protein
MRLGGRVIRECVFDQDCSYFCCLVAARNFHGAAGGFITGGILVFESALNLIIAMWVRMPRVCNGEPIRLCRHVLLLSNVFCLVSRVCICFCVFCANDHACTQMLLPLRVNRCDPALRRSEQILSILPSNRACDVNPPGHQENHVVISDPP